MAALANSQAAGLALLEAEGEGEVGNPSNFGIGMVPGSNSHDGTGMIGFDPFDVIRPVNNAYSATGGLTMLTGNLAPKGAVVKTAGVSPNMLKHKGPAVIFDSEIDAYNGIVFDKVKPGDVVVIRYEGPKGGPGMQEMLAPTTAIEGVGNLGDKCALITDGQFSRRHRRRIDRPRQPRRRPSAGRSALLKDGDIVEIDIPNGVLSVRLTRKGARRPPPRPGPRAAWSPPGYLARQPMQMATSSRYRGDPQVGLRCASSVEVSIAVCHGMAGTKEHGDWLPAATTHAVTTGGTRAWAGCLSPVSVSQPGENRSKTQADRPR